MALITRKEEYTVSEIESLLLAQEVRTNQRTLKPTESDALSMNVANMSNKEKLNIAERNVNNNYNNNQYSTNPNQRNNYQTNRGGRRGVGRNRGKGRFFQGNKSSCVCFIDLIIHFSLVTHLIHRKKTFKFLRKYDNNACYT